LDGVGMTLDKIKIGAREIRVFEVEHLSTDYDTWGDYTARTGVIRIESGIPDDMKEETLVHEVCEAINDIYNLKLSHHRLSVLAVALHQVLKDNPFLIPG
jgi:hypothetical protein